MKARWTGVAVTVMALAFAARAADQVWYDDGANALWSLSDLNWDAGTAVWTDGNNAIFSGVGETVDVSGAVSVSNITFQSNGYAVADPDLNGTLSVVGSPSVITVQNAGDAGTISEGIGGSGGFTKAGSGILNLTATNTYTGTTTVESGILRLAPGVLQGLGATGTGVNETFVASGATIDFNGCYVNSSTAERFTIAGAGVGGVGALINNGAGHVNKNLGWVTLSDDATFGGSGRIDVAGVTGNGKTLTKIGTHQLCMRSLSNAEIVINEGNFTILDNVNGLGGTSWGDTTVNGGILNCWNTYYIPERITFNGGTISEGDVNDTFYLTGHLTVNSNVVVSSSSTRGVEISGLVDGPGGFTQAGDGWFIVTCDTNTYSGPTTVNSGKSLWVGRTNLFSGVLGSGVVTNHGTLYGYSSRFSSGSLVNDGTLRAYNSMTVTTPVVLNGGTVVQGDISNCFTLAGSVTMNNIATFNSSADCGVEISGTVEGPGGFTQAGDGWVIVSGNANTYSGLTTVNSAKSLYLGRPGVPEGTLGAGPVSTWGNLYFDRSGAYSVSNAFFGSGNYRIRYGGEMTLCGSVSTNSAFRVIDGALTLTNGASLTVTSDFTLADRQSASYTNAVLNFPVTAVVNIVEGTVLNARDIIIGNGNTIPNGLLCGTINQYGGVVSTYGYTAESNGVRVGHYPLGLGTYNMMGGTFTVDNGWDLGIATDGTGWVHQTGGEIYASRVMLNERNGGNGFGRLTVEGGVLNIGLTNGILNVVSNGIMADSGAPYLVEYGGSGGIVRAITNFTSELNATLFGTNENAITFDSKEWDLLLSGNLSGEGGLNKTGSGVLALSGTNTYSGATRVLEGTLIPASASALPPGGEVLFGVAADGSCGRLYADDTLSLEGLSVGVANPELLDKGKIYTIATYGNALMGLFASNTLPEPWYVYYDWSGKTVQLRSANGTLIRVK